MYQDEQRKDNDDLTGALNLLRFADRLHNMRTSPDARWAEFYTTVCEWFPTGVLNDRFISLQLQGQALEIRVSTEHRADVVELSLFVPNTRYARKTLLVYSDGSLGEDTIGIVPHGDLTSHEPDLKHYTLLHLVDIVATTITLYQEELNDREC